MLGFPTGVVMLQRPMNDNRPSHFDLQAAAKQIMLQNGFEPDFPPEVPQQLAELKAHPPQVTPGVDVRDLQHLLWSSIDNDTSRDLDQIEVAERLPNGRIKVLVAIADVDVFVPKHSPIDEHASKETTTVYTGIQNFPMLPEELSTGASSLLENEDKLGIVIEFAVGSDGCVNSSNVYRAFVRTRRSLPTARWEHGLKITPLLPRKWPFHPGCNRNSSCRMRPRRRS